MFSMIQLFVFTKIYDNIDYSEWPDRPEKPKSLGSGWGGLDFIGLGMQQSLAPKIEQGSVGYLQAFWIWYSSFFCAGFEHQG